MPRKRPLDEMEASEAETKRKEPSLLQRIRNMWEFACVMQYIHVFGSLHKIDNDFDIEDFENECLKPGRAEKLEEIGLALLKWVSSHRGLNYDIWDEYTRRQYAAKAPTSNPYGDDEDPKHFRDFDIFTKIRVLHQLTVWTFWNPDRIRERMPEQREIDQTDWRMEPSGWDRHDREYYLFDDNRLYRRTEPPLPATPVHKAKPKSNTLKAIAARRRESKRRRLEAQRDESENETEDTAEPAEAAEEKRLESWEVDTLGGFRWECVAITLAEFEAVAKSFEKSKDPNEQELRQRLLVDYIPEIQKAEEKQRRKIERRERELLMMERMVGAKRSSRIADKHDRERKEAEQAETERKRQADLAAAHREEERQQKMEADRQYRMLTRERRIQDREYKRLLKEEELANDAEEQKRIEEGHTRGSDRNLKQRIAKNKRELDELMADDEWTFDCSGCGVHGRNLDDGSHSVACERCSVWQHSKCLGIAKSAAEKDDFHFVCRDCLQKEEEAKRPKISLKFRVAPSSSPAPLSPAPQSTPPKTQKVVAAELPKPSPARPSSQAAHVNGHPHQQSSSPPQPVTSPFYPSYLQQNGAHGPAGPTYAHAPYQQFYPPGPRQQQLQYLPNEHQQPQTSSQASNPRPFNPAPPTAASSASSSSPSSSSAVPYYQFAPYPPQTLSMGQTPLAPSPPLYRPAQPSQNGQLSPALERLPSPVLNHPTMSPTQGNMDVGPVAGIPQAPTHAGPGVANGTDHSGTFSRSLQNGVTSQIQSTPRAVPSYATGTPTPQPMSGLSPKKQQTPNPLPQPAAIPSKSNSMSPPTAASPLLQTETPRVPGSGPIPQRRTVSGTPIIPPVENLRPSPEQLKNMSSMEPVPTPSKPFHPQPPAFSDLASASPLGLHGHISVGKGPRSDAQGMNGTPKDATQTIDGGPK